MSRHPDHGTDLRALDDLDGRVPLQSGLRNLGEALARRLQTPRGGLFYAPDYGTDIRAWLNESFTPAAFFRVKVAVEAECEKDERVKAATATVRLGLDQTLVIELVVELAQGPFRLVLSVDQVSVKVLDNP